MKVRVLWQKQAFVCSRAFEAYDKAEKLGIPFLAEYDQHPSLRNRVAYGYGVITFKRISTGE